MIFLNDVKLFVFLHFINTILCNPNQQSYKINAELFLTNSTKSLDKENNNTIYFSNQENSIDFKNILLDILLVEKPIKNLCTENCKGLCTMCGINLNHKICTCSN